MQISTLKKIKQEKDIDLLTHFLNAQPLKFRILRETSKEEAVRIR